MMNAKFEAIWRSDIPIELIEAQAVICLVSEAEWITGHFPEAWKEAIASVKVRGLFKGSESQLFTIPVMQSDMPITLILVGTGQYPLNPEGLRLAAVRAAKMAVKINADQVVFCITFLLTHLFAVPRYCCRGSCSHRGIYIGNLSPQNLQA